MALAVANEWDGTLHRASVRPDSQWRTDLFSPLMSLDFRVRGGERWLLKKRRTSPLETSGPAGAGFRPLEAMHAFQECLLFRIADKSVADGAVILEGSGDLVRLVARNHKIRPDIAGTRRIEFDDLAALLAISGAIVAVIHVV